MKFALFAATLLLVAVLGGCAVGSWTRPNTTRSELYEDREQCEQQAAKTYPVRSISINVDANAIARADAADACLRAKGYVFKIGSSLAAPATTAAMNGGDPGDMEGYCDSHCVRGLVCSNHVCIRPY